MEKTGKRLVIFGVNPVMEKLRNSPEQVYELMIAKGRERTALSSIIEEARRRALPVRYVDPNMLNLLASGELHQGVVATVAPYAYRPFAELLQQLASAPAQAPILVLDGLTDPRNFGALLRSAEGAGVRHIVIPKDRSVGVTSAVVKSSAGAAHYLKIYRVSNLRRALQALKESGCWILGLDAGAPDLLYDRHYSERVAVVLGSEGSGMRPLIRGECDFLVSIPMLGKITSLNVSVAGGIVLYELVRQRRQGRASLGQAPAG